MSRAGIHDCVRLSCVTAALAILFPCAISPVRSQEGGMAADISHCESVLKGQSVPDGPAEERVKNLERGIFGKTSHGPLDKRLRKIHEALGLSGDSQRSAGVPPGTGVKPPVRNELPQPSEAAFPSSPISAPNAANSPAMSADLPTVSSPATQTISHVPPEGAAGANTAGGDAVTTKQLLQLGTQKFAKGDTLQAENIFQQVLARDPGSVDALFNLGALAERRGDLTAALDEYKKALALNSSDEELKQAVASIQGQLAKKPVTTGKGPLIGNALINSQPRLPLIGQDPQFGNPILPTVEKPPPIGQVTPLGGPTLGVTPRGGKGPFKILVGVGVQVGFRTLPGPVQVLHCPICRIIGGF
jgi:Tetratricopeptide repeat